MDPETIRLVKESWEQAGALGIDTVGKVFYEKIFEADPSLLQLFSFKSEPELLNSEKFKKHARLVVKTVGQAVSMLNQLDKLVPELQALGQRHVGYRVKQEHYPVIASALVSVLELGLGDKFTPNVRAAWHEVLGVIAFSMLDEVKD